MELGLDREFRYHTSPWHWTGIAVGLLGHLAWFVGSLLFILWFNARFASVAGQPGAPAPAVRLPLGAVVLPVLFAVMLAADAWFIARWVLEKRRAYVQVTHVGIAVHDWRDREDRMFWEEVQEMRTGAPGRGLLLGNALAELQGGERKLRIAGGVERPAELQTEIIQRAELTHRRETFWDIRYSRPAV